VSWLVRWRLALRIARRDALRHRGRTLLVLAMVGLPVLAVVGADTWFRTAELSPVEQTEIGLGAADARIIGEAREQIYVDPVSGATWRTGAESADPPWTAAEVADALPDGARIVETVEGRLTYRTRAGRADVVAVARDSDDPMLQGTLEVEDGRFPEKDGEVAISRVVADRGYVIGDTLDLTRDDVPSRVVGVVRTPPGSTEPFVVLPRSDADLLYNPVPRYLVTVPGGLDWPAVQALNEQGLNVLSREVALDPPPPAAWLPPDEPADIFATNSATQAVMALVVASVVLEVVLLAGPAEDERRPQRHGRHPPPLLLQEQAELGEAEAAAAVLLGDGDGQQSGVGEGAPQLAVDALLTALDLFHSLRSPVPLEDLRRQVADRVLLLGEREVHYFSCRGLKAGRLRSGSWSTHSTSTAMPTWISLGSTPMTLATRRVPSSSSMSPTASG
jgi:hypothetical protein